jgi:flagellar hook-basal body complex protein FliE
MSQNIGQISRIVPGLQGTIPGNPAVSPQQQSGDFSELLSNMIQSVDSLQTDAAKAKELMATGEAAELHQVMIAVEEAGLAMDLLLEIRNRLVDAYQTITRMPM